MGIIEIFNWFRELFWSKGISQEQINVSQKNNAKEKLVLNIKKDYSSPNFSVRKTQIDSIVVHHTAGSHPGCTIWLSDKESGVSAHYVITQEGAVYQLVEDHGRAWHAGRGAFDVNKDGKISQIERMWNDRSIGIELEAVLPYSYSDEQLKSLDGLTSHLMLKHHINVNMIFGHKEISPGRKFDPANFEMDDFREHIKGIMSA